jgi:uncharacterized protein
MRRRDVTLMVLASADGQSFTPVQIQKALFLLSREASELFDKGSRYTFTPYDYGPFDRAVYLDIDELAAEGKAAVSNDQLRRFAATATGLEQGRKALSKLGANEQKYVREVVDFVRRLSFADLVTAIYRKYPEMKANSVFVGA